MVQNSTKAEALARFTGAGSQNALRKLIVSQTPFKLLRCARYLGPYLHMKGKVSQERVRRCTAADAAWFDLRGFWKAVTNIGFKVQ
eukprot:6656036-Lingulodinium_polyedra.AAC.1